MQTEQGHCFCTPLFVPVPAYLVLPLEIMWAQRKLNMDDEQYSYRTHSGQVLVWPVREVEFAHLVRSQERSPLHALPWRKLQCCWFFLLLDLLAALFEVSIYGADWLTSIPWPAIVLLTRLPKTIAIILLKKHILVVACIVEYKSKVRTSSV